MTKPILQEEVRRRLARGGVRVGLAWLSAANLNPKVFIEPDQEALVQGLVERRLDWIPFNSGSLSRLRGTPGSRAS
ncbi:hypothetical protein [Cyanobium gracile]|uniref:Uncharacterized protein n=1 Tax=Cyanobium gracile (strain ATCC 27147 / PCC 6307) TaxID=292564 RepID=K9P7C4_CYAGP|nr:hypothetical protein [Cyanobium gracile]AFY28636.1 hypothetical protein Cyagr_1470 [Cyanobium gracile PCC 6307]